VDYEKKASEVPMLIIKKWMEQNLPGTEEGKTMRDGKILFMAKDEPTAQKIENNCRRLYDVCDIKVQGMVRMNESQGTIFSRSMLVEKEEDIMEALKAYRCTKVEKMESFRDGKRTANGIHILTFATREIPENVLCGYERYGVKRFYPNPMKCGICCEFGHTKNWCNKEETPICRECAEPVHKGPCTGPKKCVNCNPPDDNHSSYDRNCQKRVTEMAIIRIKTDLGISYGLARKKLEEQFDRQKESYARITGRKNYEQQRMEQEKELEEVMTRQKKIREMTERIEKENQELKRLTTGLIEARKAQKELNLELNQLRQTENTHTDTPAIIHSNSRPHIETFNLTEETNNNMMVDPFTAQKRTRSAARRITAKKENHRSREKKLPRKKCQRLLEGRACT
jgi:hypothetical protein